MIESPSNMGYNKLVLIKVNRIKRGSKVYEYARLVENYHNKQGVKVHKVIANLGQLSELTIKNLRTALKASQNGQEVVALENREEQSVIE